VSLPQPGEFFMNGKPQRVPKGSSRTKPKKIHADEVKGRHTTHWDLDYLSVEQVHAAYESGRTDDDRESVTAEG